jgi:protein involved in polysaccharide export with SLBB domain
VSSEQVSVSVASYASQEVLLFGEVPGLERAVAYRGPETVLDLLQRVGGLAPGAAPDEIQVVRTHVADGRPPEVFRVDLRAILYKHDMETNVRLEPFDQVHIGQSRTSRLGSCLPPLFRPVYDSLSGLKQSTSSPRP